jgi:hypothetical protein
MVYAPGFWFGLALQDRLKKSTVRPVPFLGKHPPSLPADHSGLGFGFRVPSFWFWFRVPCFGVRDSGSVLRVACCVLRVPVSVFGVSGSEFRDPGSGIRESGFGSRNLGSVFRVWGL